MPALALDIRVPNNIEKMALKGAKALERLSKQEAKVNALLDKSVKSGKLSNAVANKARDSMAKHKKAMIEQEGRMLVFGKKNIAADKEKAGIARTLANNYLMVKDAVIAAWNVTKAMTLDAIEKGRALEKQMQAIGYELNHWSGFRGKEEMSKLQDFASKTGIKVEELSAQWLKFRQASTNTRLVSNDEAMAMTKLWADIRGISGSSEMASKQTDEWISKLQEGPAAAAILLKNLKETYKGMVAGTGDIAKAMKGVGHQGADDTLEKGQRDIEKAMKPLYEVYDKIKATLGEWMTKLAHNKGFTSVIEKIAETVKWLMSKDGIPKLIEGIKEFAREWSKIGDDMAKTGTTWMDKVGDFFDKGLKFISPMQMLQDIKAGPPGAAPPVSPPAVPIPAAQSPTKTGMLRAPEGKQLASMTIENLIVQGGGDATQIARSIRQEIQMLMQAGALSRGMG